MSSNGNMPREIATEPQPQSQAPLVNDVSRQPMLMPQLVSKSRALLSERIAELNAGTQLEMWRQYHDQQLKMWREQQEQQLKLLMDGQKRTRDTFQTMFVQTKLMGFMFWITFLFGVLLVVISVGAVLLRPEFSTNPIIAAFFGAGALSMLAFFLRDPADKIQRAGGKLMKLQVAMNYNLLETQLWGRYFADKKAEGKEVRGEELTGALSQMREGMQVTMRHIDESLDGRLEKSGVARSHSQASSLTAKKRAGTPAIHG